MAKGNLAILLKEMGERAEARRTYEEVLPMVVGSNPTSRSNFLHFSLYFAR